MSKAHTDIRQTAFWQYQALKRTPKLSWITRARRDKVLPSSGQVFSCVSCNNVLCSPSASLESSAASFLWVTLPTATHSPFPCLVSLHAPHSPLGRCPGPGKSSCLPIPFLRVAGSPDTGEKHLAARQHLSPCSTHRHRSPSAQTLFKGHCQPHLPARTTAQRPLVSSCTVLCGAGAQLHGHGHGAAVD